MPQSVHGGPIQSYGPGLRATTQQKMEKRLKQAPASCRTGVALLAQHAAAVAQILKLVVAQAPEGAARARIKAERTGLEKHALERGHERGHGPKPERRPKG